MAGRKPANLTGQIFGKLTALAIDGRYRSPSGSLRIIWKCRCECGNEIRTTRSCLVSGNSTSCGRCTRSTLNWQNDRAVDQHGYILIRNAEFPGKFVNGSWNKAKTKWTCHEHIVIISRKIGRPLKKGETVHHKNGIRDDNSPDNLELWTRSQPAGGRLKDKLDWAVEMLLDYAEEISSNQKALLVKRMIPRQRGDS